MAADVVHHTAKACTLPTQESQERFNAEYGDAESEALAAFDRAMQCLADGVRLVLDACDRRDRLAR